MKNEWIRKGLKTNWNFISSYEFAIQWIKTHTIGKGGVALSNKQEVIHTSVTDCLVPALRICGEPELADQYEKYAKDNKGDLFPAPGPKDHEEAIRWVGFEDNLYLRALALKYLLDYDEGITNGMKAAAESNITPMLPAQINKLLMKDLEPMHSSGSLLDPVSQALLPGALCIYAELCYRLGHYLRGDKLMQTVCSLQRGSGGWFGSTGGKKQIEYFKDEEVCWVNLHFLDAIHAFDKAFRKMWVERKLDINGTNMIKKAMPKLTKKSLVLTLGCKVLPLNFAFKDNTFDAISAVFSMSYSLRPNKMIEELFRICKPGGVVIIVDKNIDRAKHFPQLPNEMWFDGTATNSEMIKHGDTQHLYFKGFGVQNMFIIWRGVKRGKK